MTGRRVRLSLPGLALLLTLAPGKVLACAACFGKSDSKLAEGMNMGIFTLLVVVVFVLGGFGAFFIYLMRRSSGIASETAVGSPQAISEGARP